MDKETLAMLFEEGGNIITMLLRNRDLFRGGASEVATVEQESPTMEEVSVPISEKATDIKTGCVPCSIGHLGTCSGLINEGMRFARKDGIQSDEVISRVNMCLDELNALERVDLRPELIHGLPDWEKTLAEQSLSLSRTLRHDLEGLSSVSQLEAVAAKTQTKRQEIGQSWFKQRLSLMSPEQRGEVEKVLRKRVEEQRAAANE